MENIKLEKELFDTLIKNRKEKFRKTQLRKILKINKIRKEKIKNSFKSKESSNTIKEKIPIEQLNPNIKKYRNEFLGKKEVKIKEEKKDEITNEEYHINDNSIFIKQNIERIQRKNNNTKKLDKAI